LDTRLVCKELRNSVEVIYAEHVLPQIEIEFKIDSRGDYLGGSLERKIHTKNGIVKGCTFRLNPFDSPSAGENRSPAEKSFAVFGSDYLSIEGLYQSSNEEKPWEEAVLGKAWKSDVQLYTGKAISHTPHHSAGFLCHERI
jgi:hypothetical protein